jgi:hypothetical protein
MRGWIILNCRAKLKRKINFTKELKKKPPKNKDQILKKKNKLNILIKGWNWKQLKVYKRDKKKIKKTKPGPNLKKLKMKNLEG